MTSLPRTLALAAALGLAACTPQIIYMKDPQTGQVVQCGPDAERTAARDCADNYRARGWVETPHASNARPGLDQAPGQDQPEAAT